MTASELKRKYEIAHPDGLFFSRNNMKFLGDTMSNYGVRDAGTHWELYRKRPVKAGSATLCFLKKKYLPAIIFRQIIFGEVQKSP